MVVEQGELMVTTANARIRRTALALWLVCVVGQHATLGQPAGPETVSTSQVQAALEDAEWVVVDTRISDAYNGWPLDGLSRGGHPRGAVNFSARWLDAETPEIEQQLVAVLRDKGIRPDKRLVLYDANGRDQLKVHKYLRAHGFPHIYAYSLHSWVDDARSLPLVHDPGFSMLLPPEIVQQLIAGKRPVTFEAASTIKFAEASWGDESASYLEEHVPGSFHINTDAIEPPPAWRLGDVETLRRFAMAHGLTQDDTVILSSEDPMAAHRVAVVLRYMGVGDVRVLNGGLAAWKQAGYAVETERHGPSSAGEFGVPVPARPWLIDTIEQVRAGLKNPADFVLVDVRSREEFAGQTSGYRYWRRAGRIPAPALDMVARTASIRWITIAIQIGRCAIPPKSELFGDERVSRRTSTSHSCAAVAGGPLRS